MKDSISFFNIENKIHYEVIYKMGFRKNNYDSNAIKLAKLGFLEQISMKYKSIKRYGFWHGFEKIK